MGKKWTIVSHIFTDALELSAGEIFLNNSNQEIAVWLNGGNLKEEHSIQTVFEKERAKPLPPHI